MNAINELAKMFKERNNPDIMGIQIGRVISPLPDLKISLGDSIILQNKHIVVAAHVISGYERNFEIENTVDIISDTNGVSVGDHGEHSHTLENFMAKGKIKWTDCLKKDDEVILIPSIDQQKFYLIDKAVRI